MTSEPRDTDVSPTTEGTGTLLPATRDAPRDVEATRNVSPSPASIAAVDVPAKTAKKIVGAVAKVISEVGVISKRGVNKFHGYKFAKMEDILEKLGPLIGKHGLMILQSEYRRAWLDEGAVVAVEYKFTLAHESGETWPEPQFQTGMCRCRDSKGGFDDKSFSKAHTSARKYFLLSTFQVATGEEDDNDPEPNTIPPRRPIKRDPDPPHNKTTGEIMDDAIPDFGPTLDSSTPVRSEGPKGEAGARSTASAEPSTIESGARKAPAGQGGAAARTHAAAPPELTPEKLAEYQKELEVAAEDGSAQLQRAWHLIPPSHRQGTGGPLEVILRGCQKRARDIDDAAKLM